VGRPPPARRCETGPPVACSRPDSRSSRRRSASALVLRNGRSARPGRRRGHRRSAGSSAEVFPLGRREPRHRFGLDAGRWRRSCRRFPSTSRPGGMGAHASEVQAPSPPRPSRAVNSRSLPALPLAITSGMGVGLDPFKSSRLRPAPTASAKLCLRPGQQPRHPLLGLGPRKYSARQRSVPEKRRHQASGSWPSPQLEAGPVLLASSTRHSSHNLRRRLSEAGAPRSRRRPCP